MRLRGLQRDWHQLGEADPMWAILSAPAKRGGRWDEEEFFALGRSEIDQAMKYVHGLVPTLPTKRALDFGCGMGRLTEALASHFDEVVGVDVAPSMIARAERRAASQGQARSKFLVNDVDNLSRFPDDHFDFIYAQYTLEHIPPPISARYIEEFVRLLTSQGAALFQVCYARMAPTGWRRLIPQRVKTVWRWAKRKAVLEAKVGAYDLEREEVVSVVENASGDVVDICREDSDRLSLRYLVMKKIDSRHS